MNTTTTKRFPLTTQRIRAIASNTFKEAVRNKAFIGLMLGAFAFLVFSLVLSELNLQAQRLRVVFSFGLFSISLFGVLIAIVMGVIQLHKEIDKKTIYTIVPKPVHRFEIIVGKYVGMLLILIVEVAALSLVWVGILYLKEAPMSWTILQALLLIFMEIMIITAVATVFSAFSRPVLSGVLTVGIFLTGRVVYLVDEMLRATGGFFIKNPEMRPIGDLFVAVFPDLEFFDLSQEVIYGSTVDWGYLGAGLGYALSYVAVLLAIAVLLFQRRDFV